jgi:hypothetical protein
MSGGDIGNVGGQKSVIEIFFCASVFRCMSSKVFKK